MLDATVQLASEIQIHDYLHVLSVSLMYWDWFITLDNEIAFMWKRAWSASAFWFFAVRYSGLVGNIPVTVFTFHTIPIQWCLSYHTGHQIVLVGTQLIVSIVMLVRIHALYGRNLRLLAVLLAISLPLLAVIFWSVQAQGQQSDSEVVLGFPGCNTAVPKSSNYHLAATWEILFFYDSLIFGFTLFKTYSTWRRTGSEASHLPIHSLVLRDGALYFAAMALANACNIATFYLAGPILSGSLSTFASCMSVTLMARLMLNLHQTADAAGDGGGLSHIDLEDCNSPVVWRGAGQGFDHGAQRDVRGAGFDYGVPQAASLEQSDAETQSLRQPAW